MTAAALKPDLFNHLFATNPTGPDQETLTATIVSLILHASVAAAVIWAGYSVNKNPVAIIADDPPTIIFPSPAPAQDDVGGQPARGGMEMSPQPAPLPIPGPPVVGIPPATPDLRTDFGVPGTGIIPPSGTPGTPGTPGGSGSGEMGAFSVVEVMPVLLNATEVKHALARGYPPMLRDAGIGGRAQLLLLIDEQGRVIQAKIKESSGQAALDRVALDVAPLMRFSPAMNRDQRVKVWAQVPLDFRTD